MAQCSLASAFHNRVATQTVLIRRFFEEDGIQQECHGTGVIIGYENISRFRGVHIVTAGHVLDGFGEGKSVWEVARIEKDEEGRCVEFRQTFRDAGTWSSFPRIMSCEYLRNCDIGLIAVENRIDGDEQSQFIDPNKHPPLKIAPRTGHLQVGARVAWAGFPGFVSDITDTFTICYFEGVVSSVPNKPPVYLIDGHTAPGVSGGPLWILQDDGEPIIVGVCIHYVFPEEQLPGLVGFCPLGLLVKYIDEYYRKPIQ